MERVSREDSPDSVGYVEEDHPLRANLAAQSVRLLQTRDIRDDDRSFSFTTSFADMDVPIFTRETVFERRDVKQVCNLIFEG